MIIKEKSGGERKDFCIRSKKFLLTYPQVLDLPDLEKQFATSLQKSFPNDNVSYFIVKELHKDGNPHIHVYLEFKHQQQIYSRDKLHVTLIDPNSGKSVIQEGKYEGVRSKDKTLEYISKHDEFGYETNMDIPIVGKSIY